MRALFTTKKAATKPAQKSSENGIPSGVDALETILALPTPAHALDSEYVMDVFTAASLNSESLQRYMNCIGSSSEKSSADVAALINVVNVHKWTPLMYAAYLGHKETSQLLLSRGANPEARNESGQTSLMMAASCGSTEIVEILLRFSARINEQDKYGRSPLHYAIKYNQAKIAELLLSRGADPNLPDIENMTPTLMACEVGNENTVAALLRHNGDANKRNKHGENGAKLAVDHPKILAIIQQHRRTTPSNATDNSGHVSNTTGSGKGNDDDYDVIIQLLRQLDLEKYERNFAEHNVRRIEDFGALNEEALTRMGITLFGPKKKLLNAIQQYRQNGLITTVSKDDLLAVEKGIEGAKNDSVFNEQAQIENELRECQRDLQRLSQACILQTHALHECKQAQAQAHRILSQITKLPALDANTSAGISTVLTTLEQTDAKIAKLLNDGK